MRARNSGWRTECLRAANFAQERFEIFRARLAVKRLSSLVENAKRHTPTNKALFWVNININIIAFFDVHMNKKDQHRIESSTSQ